MTFGNWFGEWFGQWFGSGEPAPTGSLSGSASVRLSALGNVTSEPSSAVSGSASITIGASGQVQGIGEPEESTGGGSSVERQRESVEAYKAYQADLAAELEREVAEAERLAAESVSPELAEAERVAAFLRAPRQLEGIPEPVAFEPAETLTPEQAASEVKALLRKISYANAETAGIAEQATVKESLTIDDDEALALIMILAEID